MSMDYARPLNSIRLANEFITKALSFDSSKDATGDCSQSISTAEILLNKVSQEPTLHCSEYRHANYRTDDGRILLRQKIFNDLATLERLDDDDDIHIGNGGAMPTVEAKREKQAYILTGLPASGKSNIASFIANEYGAHIVDSDYAKRKFPEFSQKYGASVLHEESSLVTFGSGDENHLDEPCIFEYCIANDFNMVIPKIGNSLKSLTTLKVLLGSRGYAVHLTLICLDRVEACRRALDRYIETDRYVPLGLVFDGYGNDPILTYYMIKDGRDWASTGKLSTLYLRAKGPIYKAGDDINPAFLFK